jgi:hypothetical protein
MKKVLFVLFIPAICYCATLGSLTRNTDVATTAEMEAFTVNPDSLQDQITANSVAITNLVSVSTYNANGAISTNDSLAIVSTPGDAMTLAAGKSGHVITIKSLDGTANNLVVTPALFNDGTTITFDADDEWVQLQSDGTTWYLIANGATINP